MSAPKPKVCFILALWGKNYIDMFFSLSLRTLLADGNIPAVAKEYDCIFTFLTTRHDISLFSKQKLFPILSRYCEIRYVEIEDTIFPGNHSATLTVALERGMRNCGNPMKETYFIFLVADYLFGRDSLCGLLPHMRKGVSAITAGNYQIVKEEVLEELKALVEPKTGVISVPNRELVAWSFLHLHPMTVANTLDATPTHALHSNRVFWRLDKDTLLGRFYLRHMLCIRPEIDNYIIGSSCDYSYVEEMCPSGNVVHLSDSDDYFVVELQPLAHEGKYIAAGDHNPADMAASLESWATAEQRANAYRPILFHSADLNPLAQKALTESEAYIRRMEAMLKRPPSPVRGHYYWLSCIQLITAGLSCKPQSYRRRLLDLRRNIWDSPVFGPALTQAGVHMDFFPPMDEENVKRGSELWLKLLKFYFNLFGRPPNVYRWHPQYLSYRLLQDALAQRNPGKVLFILPPARIVWLNYSADPEFILRTPLIMYRDIAELQQELKDVTSCVIVLPRDYEQMGNLINHLAKALPLGSDLHIFVNSPLMTRSFIFGTLSFSPQFLAMRFGYFGQKPGIRYLGQKVYAGRFRTYLDHHLSDCATWLLRNRQRPLRVLWYGIQIGLLHIAFLVNNLLAPLAAKLPLPKPKSLCAAIVSFRTGP